MLGVTSREWLSLIHILVPEKQYIDGAGQVRLRSLDTSAIAEARATGVSESELPDAHVMATQIFPASPLTLSLIHILSGRFPRPGTVHTSVPVSRFCCLTVPSASRTMARSARVSFDAMS